MVIWVAVDSNAISGSELSLGRSVIDGVFFCYKLCLGCRNTDVIVVGCELCLRRRVADDTVIGTERLVCNRVVVGALVRNGMLIARCFGTTLVAEVDDLRAANLFNKREPGPCTFAPVIVNSTIRGPNLDQ